MAISPPLIPDDDGFNELANKLAAKLSSAFGYSLAEAEEHIREFYIEYERDGAWPAADLFWHDDVALVLLIGYRLAGGNTNTLEFGDWQQACWEPLANDQLVPKPRFYEAALIDRLRAMRETKASPAEMVSTIMATLPDDVPHGRVSVILKLAFPELPYDRVSDVGDIAGRRFWKARVNMLLWWWR